MRNNTDIPDPIWVGMSLEDFEDFIRKFNPWWDLTEDLDVEEDDEYDDEQD